MASCRPNLGAKPQILPHMGAKLINTGTAHACRANRGQKRLPRFTSGAELTIMRAITLQERSSNGRTAVSKTDG